MGIIKLLKRTFRPTRDIVYTFLGLLYDFNRFYKYGGWTANLNDSFQRNYKVVKKYHSIEKSLSFRNRKQGSGWEAVEELVYLLESIKDNEVLGFHEKVSINVLQKFLDVEPGLNDNHAACRRKASELIRKFNLSENKTGGVKTYGIDTLKKGILENPENFFLTRSSVRDFSEVKVNNDDVCRAISLAQKAPSVCNRQSSHVYQIIDKNLIEKALRYQNGNTGFGHTIPCLLIITSDLRAFDTSGERYQHSIDGGMFSMSLILAFHSIGLSTCCLNWNCSGSNDLKLRKSIDIKPEHTVVMMLAVGYPRDKIKTCASERRPLSEVITQL